MGTNAGLLIDTDYAGTLSLFFKAIKAAGIDLRDITYVLATHYHPDHTGLVGELQRLGITLLLVDIQRPSVHFADEILARDRRLQYTPIDENAAKEISCAESRGFLHRIGIVGEILHTPQPQRGQHIHRFGRWHLPRRRSGAEGVSGGLRGEPGTGTGLGADHEPSSQPDPVCPRERASDIKNARPQRSSRSLGACWI